MLTILEMVCEIAIIIAITNTIPIANTIAIYYYCYCYPFKKCNKFAFDLHKKVQIQH